MAGEVAEGAALAAQHAGDPGRLGGEIDQFRQRPFRRHRHAVLDVLVALPDHLQVDGQHQRAAFGGDRALDQRLDEAAVLHHVELEPERLVDGGRDVLDRADRHRALGEGNAGGLRGAAGVNLAVAMLHAEQADRRQDQRQRGGLAEDRGRQVALGDVDQDALAELDLLQIVVVGAQRVLGIGAAIGIVEERLRHAALVQQAQILDAGDVLHGRSRPFLYFLACLSSSMVGPPAKSRRQPAPAGGHAMTAPRPVPKPPGRRKTPKSAGSTTPWRRGWRRLFRVRPGQCHPAGALEGRPAHQARGLAAGRGVVRSENNVSI